MTEKSVKNDSSLTVRNSFLCVGEVLLLALLWWGIAAQTKAMNQSLNDLSELKDPSPYRAALMGHLGKIRLGLQGFLRSGDTSMADQSVLSRKEFESLLPEFEKQNPHLFPPVARNEIHKTFHLYQDSIDHTLQENTHRMDLRHNLDQNFTQIITLIDHNIKPLIRKEQPDGDERSDAVLNIENQSRAWQKNLMAAWDQPSERAWRPR